MLIINSIDAKQLKSIHDESLFPLPDLTDVNYIGQKTIIDHGMIVGFGLVKQTLEGIIVLERLTSPSNKIRACKELIKVFKAEMSLLNYNECHAFVKDPRFARILNKLGFQESKGGVPLIVHF